MLPSLIPSGPSNSMPTKMPAVRGAATWLACELAVVTQGADQVLLLVTDPAAVVLANAGHVVWVDQAALEHLPVPAHNLCHSPGVLAGRLRVGLGRGTCPDESCDMRRDERLGDAVRRLDGHSVAVGLR